MDAVVAELSREATNNDYDTALTYTNTSDRVFTKLFGPLMQHVFNHQIHHRGQITTLFSQAGIDVGVTDLALMTIEEGSD